MSNYKNFLHGSPLIKCPWMCPKPTSWYSAIKLFQILHKKYLVDGVELLEVTSTKFLGVILDNKFTWKKHIDAVSNKISQQIGILKKVKYKLSQVSLKMLYDSFIQSHLYYCTIMWGAAYNTNLIHLQSLQKQAIRVITFSNYNEHSAPLFFKLKKLNIKNIYKFQLIMYMYRCKYKLLHNCIISHEEFSKRSHITYNIRNSNMFVPYCRTNLRKASIKFAGVLSWNSVIQKCNLQDIVNSKQFKSRVIDLLLNNN